MRLFLMNGGTRTVPGPARPVSPYMISDPGGKSRGTRRRIVRVDGRTKEGRLLKNCRKALLKHVGANPSIPQLALIERASWLELRCAVLDAKQIDGTFTAYDANMFLALVGGLRRLYREIGIQQPAPTFSELLRDSTPKRRGRPPGRRNSK